MKNNIKNIFFIICFTFLISGIALADNAKIMEVQEQGENPVLFVKGIESDVESADALVGNTTCEMIENSKLSDSEQSMKTMILLDNSLSVPENKRAKIASLISELIAARSNGEQFALATFGEDVQTVVDFTDDYTKLKNAVDAIEYVDRETYLTDVLYQLIAEEQFGKDDSFVYSRILVISDGVDNNSLGITSEELSSALSVARIPVYSVGVYNSKQSNSSELEKMFALSRMTNAEYFLLDDYEEVLPVIEVLAKDREIVKFVLELDDSVKDGSLKTIKLNIHTSSGDTSVNADNVRVAQVVAQAEAEEEVQEETKEETVQEETPVVTEDKAQGINLKLILILLALLIAAAVAVAVVLIIRKKKKENEIREVDVMPDFESMFQTDNNQTEILQGNSKKTGSGNTLQLFETGTSNHITLTDIDSPAKSFSKNLLDNHSLVIGRSSGSTDICIDYDKSVSSTHCKIEKRGEHFYVSDLKSTNKTYLDDVQVLSETEVYSGCVLKIGRVRLRIDIG